MSHIRYFIAPEEDLAKAHDGDLFCSRETAERLCGNLCGNTGKPWKVFECVVSLPDEGQYAGDRRELRRALNEANVTNQAMGDAILRVWNLVHSCEFDDPGSRDELVKAAEKAFSLSLKAAFATASQRN